MKIFSHALYIKRCNLADEAKLIRKTERKLFTKAKDSQSKKTHKIACSLQSHRRTTVNGAARTAHLAHCALNGISYSRAEMKTYEPPSFKHIEDLASRMFWQEPIDKSHQERQTMFAELFAAWKLEAIKHLKSQGHVA